ncbi:MAG: phosphatidate cytidylyltransferase [Gammaproteobacteria bacterium]|nr:phosphatidate cytidylyltransferase [Gammaproteobacteria bacterium]|tara:strand:+ start:12 stop:614 length:603 start_codon:yes stop_codon:yes gene_type:complete
MFKRIITSLFLITLISLIIFSSNIWIFASSILLICSLGLYEWIKNSFSMIFVGLAIILNFGFWSIYFVSIDESNYVLFGLIIFNTAIFDTFAYVIGSKIGKRFIVKKISPKKTLEGLIGGLFATVVFGMLIKLMLFNGLLNIFIIGGIFAFFGDLFISYFKRKSGVKDTGNILPGHGGVLDRIDSHLFATPVLIYILLIL